MLAEHAWAPVIFPPAWRDPWVPRAANRLRRQGKKTFSTEKRRFCAIFTNVKAIILPRQARDKHRTNSRTSGVFLSGWVGAAVSRTRIHDAFYASKNRYPFFRHFNLGAILDLCLPSHYRRMYLAYMMHMEEAGRFSRCCFKTPVFWNESETRRWFVKTGSVRHTYRKGVDATTHSLRRLILFCVSLQEHAQTWSDLAIGRKRWALYHATQHPLPPQGFSPMVRKPTPLKTTPSVFCVCIQGSFYQDRLGTNAGETNLNQPL